MAIGLATNFRNTTTGGYQLGYYTLLAQGQGRIFPPRNWFHHHTIYPNIVHFPLSGLFLLLHPCFFSCNPFFRVMKPDGNDHTNKISRPATVMSVATDGIDRWRSIHTIDVILHCPRLRIIRVSCIEYTFWTDTVGDFENVWSINHLLAKLSVLRNWSNTPISKTARINTVRTKSVGSIPLLMGAGQQLLFVSIQFLWRYSDVTSRLTRSREMTNGVYGFQEVQFVADRLVLDQTDRSWLGHIGERRSICRAQTRWLFS